MRPNDSGSILAKERPITSFAHLSDDLGGWADVQESYPIAVGAGDRSFRHEAGRKCFDLHVAYVGKPGQAVSGCQLMSDPATGKVDCFGCSGANCKTAPAGWSYYSTPTAPGTVGIPYACFASENGCQLAQ
jgi:hypothetical protein